MLCTVYRAYFCALLRLVILLTVLYNNTRKQEYLTDQILTEVKKMMSCEEMKKYLIDELKEERRKMLMNQDNKYSYIFMICNDMGIIDPKEF